MFVARHLHTLPYKPRDFSDSENRPASRSVLHLPLCALVLVPCFWPSALFVAKFQQIGCVMVVVVVAGSTAPYSTAVTHTCTGTWANSRWISVLYETLSRMLCARPCSHSTQAPHALSKQCPRRIRWPTVQTVCWVRHHRHIVPGGVLFYAGCDTFYDAANLFVQLLFAAKVKGIFLGIVFIARL